jgi:hypothetical protein
MYGIAAARIGDVAKYVNLRHEDFGTTDHGVLTTGPWGAGEPGNRGNGETGFGEPSAGGHLLSETGKWGTNRTPKGYPDTPR